MEENQALRTRIIKCRLTSDEYKVLEKKWKSSTCSKLSDFIRKRLFDQTIVTTYRNSSLDEFMVEMIKLRVVLSGVANNFNQAVKKLHLLNQTQDFRNWLAAYELEKKILMNKVDEVKKKINRIADLWLQ